MDSFLPNFLAGVPTVWLIVGAAVVVAIVFLVIFSISALLKSGTGRKDDPHIDLSISVADLSTDGPPEGKSRLEFYGTPVRLAVLVLAPAGRNRELPTGMALSQAVDALLPGLAGIVTLHKTDLRRWPSQMSTQGFTNSFFNKAPLPGQRGKGTPWCSIAGRFDFGDGQFLAGLVCVADAPNSLSQVTVQHAGQWLDAVRVKSV